MEPPTASSDSGRVFQVHFLDMGAKKYGDCIVCLAGRKRILIDGGHLGDQRRSHPSYPSIPEQLEEILGQPAPWRFDLLVVTHCHVDHIGCLPNLVSAGSVTAQWALVADEDLGWGDVEGGDAPALADAPEPVRQIFALLREERPSFATREEMEAFASDAARMRTSYRNMLETLGRDGTRVVRYGRDDPAALLRAFRSTGLKILGPDREHLLTCAHQIAALGRDAVDAISVRVDQDAPQDLVRLYRELRQGPATGADSGDFDLGNAINDQSIVLSFKVGDRKVLLTGDMQLADPLVPGLEDAMAALRRTIAGNGPYDLVKLPHHGARNAVDAGVLTETRAPLLAISGGYGSSKHPHARTLDVLKAAEGVAWYRTDRNGLISVDLATEDLEVGWVRGEENEGGQNEDARDFLEEPEPEEPAASVTRSVVATPDGEVVEVLARIPHRRTKVVITIEVEPSGEPEAPVRRTAAEAVRVQSGRPSAPSVPALGAGGPAAAPALRVGGGRQLPPLLFATDPDALADNIGREEAGAVRQMLETSGHAVVLDSFRKMSSRRAGVQIRNALSANPEVQGIVLVGGYDVIPPDSVDVLSATHRRSVDPRYDQDRFLVWSDDFYGDLDDDDFPELPVSRVPDGRTAQLLQTALAASRVELPRRRAGLRNLKRPFAQEIFDSLPGDAALLVSHPASPDSIEQEYLAADAIYLMLHGRATNARTFLGETDTEEMFEAIDRRNLRPCPGAVVFTGCCWGALTVETTAWTHDPRDGFAPRSPEASLALGFLAAGANAFVGCTGVHYSPRIAPYKYASGPLHHAFWRHVLVEGLRPASALLEAKRTYRKGMPYPNPIPGEDPGAAAAAVEKKLLAQLTCLGLGW